MSKNHIFNLIKKQKFKKLNKYLLNNININLDIKDENYNYLIHYIIIYNQIEILNILFNRNIRIDILDIDGRSILYNPIRYNYIEILKLLLEYNKKLIGISILDIKDKLGNTALHYAVLLNNFNIVKILFNNNADPLLINNKGINVIYLALQYMYNDIIKYFIENKININFLSINNESLLQLAILYQNIEIINLLINKIDNINNQENNYGLSAIHQSIVLNNNNIFEELILNGSNINIQDYYGNSPLIYLIIEKNNNLLDLFIKYNNIDYNLTNIDGNTGLHILLEDITQYQETIISKLIIETDLSIQNNNGDTCLHYLIINNLLLQYKDLIINKEVNIFIKNSKNISCFDLINNNQELIDIIINSYYNYLKNNKNKLEIQWEKNCIKNKLDKICYKKINEIIFKEKRSISKLNNYEFKLDSGIFINTCYFTGSPIDILFGIIFLFKKFNDKKLGIILDYPLSNNSELEKYYEELGINFNNKLNFCNFEIIWAYQKIFFPTYFDDEINKALKKYNYIIIPIGIQIQQGAHANILFWDVKKNIIERFEPNGANEPINFNYNNKLLDNILLKKFKNFDNKINIVSPKSYLPIIGFQILESQNTNSCKRIGDPNGFCAVWCIWWIYQKMNNLHIDSKILVEILIKEIKLNNYNFKTIIRNFSSNIVDLRDKYLKKFNLDINDWINNNYSDDILNNLENDILKYII